jgi:uncharacterized repeat protein (TIGR02543 family)
MLPESIQEAIGEKMLDKLEDLSVRMSKRNSSVDDALEIPYGFTPKQYTLTFNTNGGTAIAPITANYGSDITAPANPTKTGYTFEGWDKTIPAKMPAEDMTFTAKWTVNHYTLTYNLNGASDPGNPASYTVESGAITLSNPTRAGYKFAGWTGTGLTEATMTVTIPQGSTGNRSYTATWLMSEVAPKLSRIEGKITLKKGRTVTGIRITAEAGDNLSWSTSGELPEGLTYQTDSRDFVIRGTVSGNAETRDYLYAVKASNTAGTDEVQIIITVTESGSGTSNSVQTTVEDIEAMTHEELQQTFGGKTDIVLMGNVSNLSQVLDKLETVTSVKNLDLSLAQGLTEVRLEDRHGVETLTLAGNQSVKTVDVTGNTILKMLDLTGSKVEMVDAGGCENLEEVNVEGCELLAYLDVSGTSITSLNTQNCVNLETLNCASCDLHDLKIEGCESLETLDCSNNHLTMLEVQRMYFKNLRRVDCRNQRVRTPSLPRVLSILDILFGRSFGVSVADESEEALTSYVAKVEDIIACDESGNEIQASYDKMTGEVTFSKEPAEMKYNYVTGFEDVKMDVTVTADTVTADEEGGVRGIGSSNSGCSTGFGDVVLFLIATYFCGFLKGLAPKKKSVK